MREQHVQYCCATSADTGTGEALEAWAAQGALTLHTAFSRVGPDKVYVQQRVAETADALFSLLSVGAHFYVCGDANAMAVRRASNVCMLNAVADLCDALSGRC